MNRPKSPEHTSIHNDIASKRLNTSGENEEKKDPTIEITAVAIKMKTLTTTSTITSTALSATPPNTSDFLNTNDFTRLFIPFAHTDTLMKLRLTSKTWKTITDIHIDNGIQAGTSMVHDGTDTAYGAIDVFKRKLITQVFFHHNATKIGTHACMHVSNLLIVDIPEGVESISMGAFWGCIHLKQVSFPSTLKSIKYRSFRNCSELKTAYLLHTKLEELGSNAFFGCKDLQSMTIPPSLKKFGSNVFEECYGLVSREMRSKTFDNDAVVAYLRSIQSAFPTDDFMHTNGFKRRLVAFVSDDTLMALRSTMKAWRVVAEEVFNEGVASGAMMVCDGNDIRLNINEEEADVRQQRLKLITRVIFSLDITKVGNFACAFFTNLVVVDIPEGVESIGEFAFSCCYSLTTVYFPKTLKCISKRVFDGCSSLENVDLLHTNLQELGTCAFIGCYKLKSITIPDSLQNLGESVFDDCHKLVPSFDFKMENDTVAVVAHLRFKQK